MLYVKRMDRFPNVRIRELWGVKKGLDDRTDESVSGGLSMWREWRMTGLPRESMLESVLVVV